MSLKNIPDVSRGRPISAAEENQFRAAVRGHEEVLDTAFVDGKGFARRRNAGFGIGTAFIRAKITASTVAENPPDGKNRWLYSWEEVEKTEVGYGTLGVGPWTTKSGGRSGTENAYNYIEAMNDDSGVEGCGVNVSGTDFPSTFGIKEVPAGVVVLLEQVTFTVDETTYTEYWFCYENAVDGTCD